MRALERGKHVFVEKPLCQTEEQARDDPRGCSPSGPSCVLSSNLLLRAVAALPASSSAGSTTGASAGVYYMEGDYDYGRLWKLTEGWRGDLETLLGHARRRRST